MESSIFISCRHQDISVAKTLQQALKDIGDFCVGEINVYLYEDIQGGQDWRKWIEKKIKDSKILIFLCTDDQFAYRWCHYEMGMCWGMHHTSGGRIIGIKSPIVGSKSSPIRNLQSYNGDKKGIYKLLSDLFAGNESILGDKGSLNRFKRIDTDIETAAIEISKQFTHQIKKQKLLPELAIELSTIIAEDNTCGEDNIVENKIDETIIQLSRSEELFSHTKRYYWKQLYSILKKQNQHLWMDDLKNIIKKMRSTDCFYHPGKALSPFSLDNRKSFIPVFSYYEKYRDKTAGCNHEPQDYQEILKKVVVNFVPHQTVPRNLRDIFDRDSEEIYAPASLVRMMWKKMSGDGSYRKEDQDGDKYVIRYNEEFRKMFYLGQYAGKGGRRLTEKRLLEKLEQFDCIDYLEKLANDQKRLEQRIIFDCMPDKAIEPLQFNSTHPSPEYRNTVYLPYMICKQTVGDLKGPHETLYLICFVLDFWPNGFPVKKQQNRTLI